MKRIGLWANWSKPGMQSTVVALQELAARVGVELLDEPRWDADGAEAVLALGGDGTMLSAAYRVAGRDLPLLGFNAGSLGYLTHVEEREFGAALEALAADRFAIEERTMLGARVLDAQGNERMVLRDALNEVVVARGASGRALALELWLDGRAVATYVCDGIIFATPTGSTAYSLSVGGPIVLPGVAAWVMSVISPHTLTSRPLVVPDGTMARVRHGGEVPWLVCSDGQEDVALHACEVVEVALSARRMQLIVFEGFDAFGLLSRKLGWGGGRREGLCGGELP